MTHTHPLVYIRVQTENINSGRYRFGGQMVNLPDGLRLRNGQKQPPDGRSASPLLPVPSDLSNRISTFHFSGSFLGLMTHSDTHGEFTA